MLNTDWIDPICFSIGPLTVRWYGILFALGFFLVRKRALRELRKQPQWAGMATPQGLDLFTQLLCGALIGARIGYFTLYAPEVFFKHPCALFRIGDGGMSFHGGIFGGAVTLALLSAFGHCRFFVVSDAILSSLPLALCLGRVGNFINGELWGRDTELPWGCYFEGGGPDPRHPSQLYEAFLEGALLWFILGQYNTRQSRQNGQTSGAFLVLYGCFRFIVEYYREPDGQCGFLWFEWTMGQWLSLPMVVIGLIILGSLQVHARLSTQRQGVPQEDL